MLANFENTGQKRVRKRMGALSAPIDAPTVSGFSEGWGRRGDPCGVGDEVVSAGFLMI